MYVVSITHRLQNYRVIIDNIFILEVEVKLDLDNNDHDNKDTALTSAWQTQDVLSNGIKVLGFFFLNWTISHLLFLCLIQLVTSLTTHY